MYKKSLLTFLDILGFGNIVETKSPDQINKVLQKLMIENKLQSDSHYDSIGQLGITYNYHSFSDSIIRFYQFENEPSDELLMAVLAYEIELLTYLQREVFYSNFCIRGGLAYNDFYYSTNEIFGPALIEAYNIESKISEFPRITISRPLGDKIPDSINRATETSPEERNWQQETIIESLPIAKKDPITDYYFIDYIGFDPEMGGDIDKNVHSFFNDHSNYIKNALAENEKEPVLRKYRWLKERHNAGIRKLRAKYNGLDDY
jgi:hypothetical protein